MKKIHFWQWAVEESRNQYNKLKWTENTWPSCCLDCYRPHSIVAPCCRKSVPVHTRMVLCWHLMDVPLYVHFYWHSVEVSGILIISSWFFPSLNLFRFLFLWAPTHHGCNSSCAVQLLTPGEHVIPRRFSESNPSCHNDVQGWDLSHQNAKTPFTVFPSPCCFILLFPSSSNFRSQWIAGQARLSPY